LTFFGSTTGDKSQTLPDTGIMTDTNYAQSPNKFTDAGTLTYKGSTYQIDINTFSTSHAQNAEPVSMNIPELKGTQPYKDTLAILNSFSN